MRVVRASHPQDRGGAAEAQQVRGVRRLDRGPRVRRGRQLKIHAKVLLDALVNLLATPQCFKVVFIFTACMTLLPGLARSP